MFLSHPMMDQIYMLPHPFPSWHDISNGYNLWAMSSLLLFIHACTGTVRIRGVCFIGTAEADDCKAFEALVDILYLPLVDKFLVDAFHF